jgi:hypothetical protein
VALKDDTQIADVREFLGLRTDTPASKCPPGYSPDCGDMVFSPGGMATRGKFIAVATLPATIVWRKEFTCKDGSTQILALDITGKLYTVSGSVATQIDTVTPGCMVSSVTAYGKEWMAFYLNGQGCDAPRQWDGKNLYRVSQGGPGAPPTVTNLALASSAIASGSRTSNVVTIVTSTPHNLLRGYLATIGGVDAFIENITSIVINNSTLPGIGVVTVPSPHGLIPGVSVAINDVQPIAIGGGITGWSRTDGLVTVTTATNHGLQPGSTPLVELQTAGFGPVVVLAVPSLTTFTFTNSGGNGTGTTGAVMLPWPLASGTLFTVTAVPTSTTFQFAINFTNGTWTTGDISFDWNGAFFVESVISSTSFTYRQIGPDATITSGGTVLPTGQIPAGEHLVCQHFIDKTGFLTAPSPPVRFTASGGQYVQVTNLAIGPAETQGRALSLTGANGSRFFILLIPAQVNGLQVSTSTVINDNTTTSAVLDFSDLSLLSATAIDIPGNNLFQQTTLNLPRGVDWYENRLFWIGEKNTVFGLLNMGMDGGTLSGSTAPLGWTRTGAPAVTQVGIMPALVGTGSISQPAATTAGGNVILQPILNYSLRAWLQAGTVTATISSVSTGFTSTANLAGTGYVTANFSLAMPAAIPADMLLTVTLTGATIRDLQLIYADNPNRNPVARASYVQNPEAYDNLTGNIGPSDDNTELRAIFVLQESLHFLTQRRLYSAQQIGNSEPSSWFPTMISDDCGAFDANSTVTGKGWAAWAGQDGVFWYGGGIPNKTSAIIAPIWRKITGVTNVFNDSDAERVYFGTLTAAGKSMLVYDYHEVGLGGAGKWCPWNRPVNWICDSSTGPVFVFGQKFYNLGAVPAVADDDLGNIGGYYTFSPIGLSMFKKQYTYAGLKIAGSGVLTPFLYSSTLAAVPFVLNGQELSTLIDTVAEWQTLSLLGRLLYLKLGQPGVQFTLEEATVIYGPDPNAPISGVR